jgi:Ca2+:H+ antiporter
VGRRFGHGIGGLLNASFGNAAEFIIVLMALSKGLINVVKASITGSIIGNILLVLGLSILTGGLRFSTERFNRTAARIASTSLSLAAIGLMIPTVFHLVADLQENRWSAKTEQTLSLAIAVILFLSYVCSLIFSLKTHKELYRGTGGKNDEETSETWSATEAIATLFVATAVVAVLSEFLVSSVEAMRAQFGLSELFVGIVIIAIIGNAAEHSTAVMMAFKNKMDLAMRVAIGSSTQIALFVAPLFLFCSYFFGSPMNFEFTIPETIAVIAAVYLLSEIAGDGETNWLEGVQLLALYFILAVLFFFLPAR